MNGQGLIESQLAKIGEAAKAIQSRWNESPEVGLVLGSGSGQVAEHLDVECRLRYPLIPHFPRSTSIGHRGALICGRLAGKTVVAMQGRFHLYEGHSLERITLPIHVMQRLGIQRLLISNAAGGVNPAFNVGDLMLIESTIDLFFRTCPQLLLGEAKPSHRTGFRPDQACDENLLRCAVATGRANGFEVHRGVYVGMLGPNYETRAEYRMCRRIGGDAVGMSTIPEIATASRYGIPTLAVSIITNMAVGAAKVPTTGHGVVETAEKAGIQLLTVFKGAMNA